MCVRQQLFYSMYVKTLDENKWIIVQYLCFLKNIRVSRQTFLLETLFVLRSLLYTCILLVDSRHQNYLWQFHLFWIYGTVQSITNRGIVVPVIKYLSILQPRTSTETPIDLVRGMEVVTLWCVGLCNLLYGFHDTDHLVSRSYCRFRGLRVRSREWWFGVTSCYIHVKSMYLTTRLTLSLTTPGSRSPRDPHIVTASPHTILSSFHRDPSGDCSVVSSHHSSRTGTTSE